MVIDEPHVTIDRDEVVLEAAVELEKSNAGYPGTLYFAFPRSHAAHVAERADAFAAALLPLAMRRGERLLVRGELSCRLAHGLREYQHIQVAWKPQYFSPVEIECESVSARDPGEATGAVGTAFSGGVDSFHTLWTHCAANERYAPYAITHCVMINGFDQDMDLDGGGFDALVNVYQPALAELGISLVVARTNLLRFVGNLVQKQAFGSFVSAPALALGRLLSRYYVPSSYKFTRLGMFPDGSHPMMDHLLSSESMQTIHDGGHLTRVEKTVAISHWPATFDRLRVCFHATRVVPETGTIANCCACEKCLRTMVTLDLAGALARYTCFPKPFERRDLRNLDYNWPGSRIFAEEIIEFAGRAGRPEVARDLRRAIFNSVWYHPRLGRIAVASHALEGRSRLWAAAVSAPKWALKRLGFGRGWLY